MTDLGLDKSLWPRVIDRLESGLGRPIDDVTEARLLWKAKQLRLFDARDVKEPEDMAALLEDSLEEIEARGARHAPPNRRAYRTPALLTPAESKREEVFGWLVGLQASELPLVRDFRRRFVRPRLFGASQARSFLRSAPHRLLSGARLAAEGLPTLGLAGEQFQAPPTTFAPFGPSYIQETKGGSHVTITRYGVRCTWTSESGEPNTREIVIEVPESVLDSERASTRAREFGLTSAPIVPGSPLDELLEAAEDLANRTWWPKPHAMLFILTGKAPPTEAVQKELSFSGPEPAFQVRLTITTQPWVSQSSVRKIYRDSQRWARGREGRRLEISTLERFRFVHELRRARPEMDWPALAEVWNRGPGVRNRTWRVEWRRLYAEYNRTLEALLLPDLALGSTRQDMEFVRALRDMYPTYRAAMLERLRTEQRRSLGVARSKRRRSSRKPTGAGKPRSRAVRSVRRSRRRGE